MTRTTSEKPMIATTQVNGAPVSTFRARVVALDSASKFTDEKQRATVRVEACDQSYNDLRFPIPETLGLELDDVLVVSVSKVQKEQPCKPN